MCRRGRAGRHALLVSVTHPYASVSLEHNDRLYCHCMVFRSQVVRGYCVPYSYGTWGRLVVDTTLTNVAILSNRGCGMPSGSHQTWVPSSFIVACR
jgi:hypothetical protein